ncbi:MAG: methyltransferase domain-containing protein, partial [Alcanivorax sp.]|nr:methyltransferase domain-containing protein [Alcanivorax sp.]
MNADPEQRIIDCWHDNAASWRRLMQQRSIASRRHTDPAIIDMAIRSGAGRVLDIGCGEGWLCRALSEHGMAVTGTDAVAELLEQARRCHPAGTYLELDYEALINGALPQHFDLVICNFSLFGEHSVERLLEHLSERLHDNAGTLLIQTLHPLMSCQQQYRDGWREGSWPGCDDLCGTAPPWYFRTLGSWLRLLAQYGFQTTLHEPCDPHTGLPLSAIFEAR